MANAIYDFSPEARWSGYVGAGLGMARISADFNGAGGSIEGDAHISFGEGSTMNNYLLDRWIDECWPDTSS